MKIKLSTKIVVVSLVVAFIVILINGYFGRLLYQQILSTTNKIEQISIATIEREKMTALEHSLDTSTSSRAILDQYFITADDADTANFIDSVENIAKQGGLEYVVSGIDYDKNPEFGSLTNLNFIKLKINVTGNWLAVWNFLQTIENLPKVLVISSVTLDTSAKNIKGQINKWSADLEFSVAKIKK